MSFTFRATVSLSVLCSCALAQINRATAVGRVTDSSGAVIAGAEVQMRRIATNEVFKTETTSSGDYTIVNLPVGEFEIKASMQGFKSEVRSRIELEIGSTNRFDFALTVGSIAESIEVTSQAAVLRTESPEMGQVIGNKTMTGLALNSRDFLSLARLIPGVVPSRGSTGDGGRDSAGFSVEGRRRSDNIVYVDGSIMSDGNGSTTFFPNIDALQEMELKTGLYSAEFGVRPGGQFSTVTKSGTNKLHGTAFWFHRNDGSKDFRLSARNYFDPGPKPEYKRNQFGGVISGPLFLPKLYNGKDRAWFMVANQGERERRFTNLRGLMPTVDEKAGRFAVAIRDPFTRAPLPNNTIPASRINPVTQKFLSMWPEPNIPLTSGQNFISPNSTLNQIQNQWMTKIDFNLSPTNRWYGRVVWDERPLTRTSPIAAFNQLVDYLGTYGATVANTRTFRATYVNDFSVHLFRRPYDPGRTLSSGSQGFGQTVGWPSFPLAEADVDGVPTIGITGYTGLGDNGILGSVPIGNWEVKDNLAFNKGAHFLKMGYHWRRHFNFFVLNNRSSLAFNRAYAGNNFADFLFGTVGQSTLGAEGTRGNFSQTGQYLFLQDDWKVSSKLTLNLGLRYEYRGPWKDKRGFFSNVNPVTAELFPPLQNLSLRFWETGRFEANYPVMKFENHSPLPRIGAAYRVSPKIVIRTGYGMYANEPVVGMTQQFGANPRPNAAARAFVGDITNPTISLSDPFNLNQLTPGGGLLSLFGMETALPLPVVHAWNFTVQRALTSDISAEIGYSGNSSVHELQVVAWNDAVPGPGNRQNRRPFPQYQNITMVFANANSNYHGMEVKLQKRPGKEGVYFLTAFTWAKSIDATGGRLGVEGDPSLNSRNYMGKVNRGRSEADNPGRFTLGIGWELPFGKGRRFALAGPLNSILGGWSTDTFLQAQVGPYLTPGVALDTLDSGTTASYRPDITGNPNLSAGRTTDRWFDTSVFRQPAQFSYGNAGRSIIQGPGYTQWDFSLHKDFWINERSRVEFRFEGFNFANTGNLRAPGLTFGTPAFGRITAAQEARDLQFGLKIYF